jgi:phage protein D
MFSSQLGIRLILMVGKTIPLPAPPEILQAFTRIEVTSDGKGNDGFQMTFTLGKDKTGEYGLVKGGLLDPDTIVAIGVLLGVKPEPLMHGVIYHHQIAPSSTPGQSTLTVSGRSVSVLLDLEESNQAFEQQTDSAIVTNILQKYMSYGILPQVTSTTEQPSATERIPGQHETDLKLIERLAKRNSFVFYVEPKTMGTSQAYWGCENRQGAGQPALTIGLGAAGNVKSLQFVNDALAPVDVQGSYIDLQSKKSTQIPPVSDLYGQNLASLLTKPRRTERLRNVARLNSTQVDRAARAARTNAAYPVSARGELEVVRYGGILRARRLVAVRGGGRSQNGTYIVQQVTHIIIPGHYTQSFALGREGTGATTATV